MKNIKRSLIALLAFVAISCSVEDVQDRPVIEGIDTPVLTAPAGGASYVLTPATADAQAERFTWNSANYGGDVEVSYKVEMDKKGNDFKTPQELGTVKSENQTSVSVSKMNSAALALGAIPFASSDYEIRVKSDVGGNVMFSNVVAVSVTSYTTESPKLWIPGGYQTASKYGSDWTPASAPQLQSSGYGKTDFEGYVYFAAASEFLLTPAANFDNKYTKGATAGTLLYNGNDNLAITAAGFYKIKADTDPAKLTYSTTKLAWGVVGNATPGGWDADTPMTYNPDTKKWTVTVVLTAQTAPDNGMKFRANNNWDYNFGDDEKDGILEDGGKNIGTTAGTFLITLDLSTPRHYTYTIVKQ
jgi:starch-binding outer membrane protein SusE/F